MMSSAETHKKTEDCGLYIHVPFCHAKCFYCDFYSLSATEDFKEKYVATLLKEYELRRNELPASPSTIYFGGGTPSSLSISQFSRIMKALPKDKAVEVTVEVNPEDVVEEKIKGFVDMGVNRVSMGVQSLIDTELKAIGRRHTADEALQAVDNLRRWGIDNISLDLIYGLPGQTLATWQQSLNRLIDTKPEHLSAYILSYEDGTRMTKMLQRGEIEEAKDEDIERMYQMLCSTAAAAGYEHYEISNFAQPGKRAQHNSSYWTGRPYLGLGPGAHSFDGVNIRRANPHSLRQWTQSLAEGSVAFEEEEESEDTAFNSRLMVALRTAAGISIDEVADRQLLQSAKPYIEREQLVKEGSRLYIPEQAWLLSDAIISDLMIVD